MFHRPLGFGLILAAAVACGSAPAAWAWQLTDQPQPETRTVITADGVVLYLTYWPSQKEQDAPVALFLHGEKGRRLDWPRGLCELLQQRGFAVIAADLRGHGQSTNQTIGTKTAKIEAARFKPRDYANIVQFDLETIKEFLYEEHQAKRLNMNKLAVIAADSMAPLALSFAANDWLKPPHPDGIGAAATPRGQDVRAIVLLSPANRVGAIQARRPLELLRDPQKQVALLVSVGSDDTQDKEQAQSIVTTFTTGGVAEGRSYFEKYATAKRGTALLSAPKAAEHLATFLEQHVNKLDSPWRDRESKIGRDEKK